MSEQTCSGDPEAANVLLPLADLEKGPRKLIETAEGFALLGGECGACGKRFFPSHALCPYCAAERTREVALARRGILYSYSKVFVSSARTVPYTIGYVDFDQDVRVLATIEENVMSLRPDMPVELCVSETGQWSFAPVRTETRR
jgi:uncharacterized protein